MSEPQRRDLDERLADWVDGRMSPRDRERFLAELRVNPQLKRDLEQYERTVGIVRAALRAPTAPSRSPMADRVLAAIAAPAPVVAPQRAWFGQRLAWGCGVAAALLVAAVWLNEWSAAVPQRTTVATEDADSLLRLTDAPADPAQEPVRMRTLAGLDESGRQPAKASENEAPPPPPPATEAVREQIAVETPAVGPADTVPKQPTAVPVPAPQRAAGELAGGGQAAPTGARPAAPAGPATGGPAGPAAPVSGGRAAPGPSSPGPTGPGGGGGGAAPGTTGSDDFYLGAMRRVAPTAPAPREGAPAPAAPGTKPGASDETRAREQAVPEAKQAAVPMLAYVVLEGVEGGATFGARGNTPEGTTRGAVPGGADSKAKSGDAGAGGAAADKLTELDARKMAELAKEKADAEPKAGQYRAPTPLAPEALAAAFDRFLAAAVTTAAEPAAEQWVTARGTLSASPWLTPTELAPGAPKRDEATPQLPRERAWLVEGDRSDVELLLRRAAAVGRARRLTVSQGEMPVPPEFVAPSVPADAGAGAVRRPVADGAAADLMRIVLRVRLRAR